MTSFQPDSTPIFAHADHRYHFLVRCVGARKESDGFVFEGVLDNDEPVPFVVNPITPHIIRIRYNAAGGGIDHDTPFTVPYEPEEIRADLHEDEAAYSFETGAMTVRVNKSPWQMVVRGGDGTIVFQQELWDRAFVIPVTYPTGYSADLDGRIGAHETFSLESNEHLFGLGPKYMSVNKRGHRAVMWCADTFGTNTTDLSYISVPFFLSSRGYGLFLNHGSKSIFELGSYSAVGGSIWVDSPLMDYYLIIGKTPAEILMRYAQLTGRPPVLPKWALGVWMSRCRYLDRATVETVVERMRSLEIPLDVVNIDPAWLKAWVETTQPGCEFEWNTADFPDPDGFLRGLREHHVRVCLWENPYVPGGTAFYEEGKQKGYLVKKPDGSLAEPDHPLCSGMGLIDYTNPAAVEWVKEAHRRLLRQGVAAFKTDYGEGIPEDTVFHNGETGREMHNVYPLLYNRAVYEAIEEMNREAILFGRSGGPGSQRYPIQWAGDSQCNFAGMAGSLKGGLSYALSGGAWWSHDIGGFVNPVEGEPPPTPTLYIRWAQFGLLSPITRFHGIGPREPWEFGEEALEIVRKFALLRSRLIPYLYSYGHEASQSGLPVMRPVYLEFPDDPHAPFEELEYFLGRELLVAPVFNDAGKVTVYLPKGTWSDFWTGTLHKGPAFLKLTVPIDSIPLYVREDSIVPLGKEMQYAKEHPWDEFQIGVYLKRKASFTLYDGTGMVRFDAVKKGRAVEFRISPSHKTYDIVFHKLRNATAVEGSGSVSDMQWKSGEDGTRISLKAAGAIALKIRV
ncbi:MAG: glycoside hydrolase family 31 protein [Candidatus Abyssobacteria bacterium SURF_17]|uniref:Glycoside hydrolase family 31 protein n=1 Tax=Candidatus Abyssobacteria bacterium SURF_17 TaxID=2093361 RepID=A0A419EU55_9BACT|nr:MAG: glycoside hydrolase family 31 protein [Candidatus Abyssubacteria bacterium SURF_17]